MMMGMLLLLLKMASIIIGYLVCGGNTLMPYFCLYNNSIEHLLKTGQLNTKPESRLVSDSDPTFFL